MQRCSSSRASPGDYNSVCMRLCVSVQSGVCKHHQLACVKLITHVCCVCETGNGTILHTQNDESTSNSCNTVLHIYTIYTYILYTHIYYMYCYRCGAHVAPTRARHTRLARARGTEIHPHGYIPQNICPEKHAPEPPRSIRRPITTQRTPDLMPRNCPGNSGTSTPESGSIAPDIPAHIYRNVPAQLPRNYTGIWP